MKICFIMCHTGEDFGIMSDSQYAIHTGYEQWYCKAMLKLGYDVILVVLSKNHCISKFDHIFGHTILRVPVSINFGVSRQFSNKLFKIIKTDLKDVDIFHIHSFYALLYEPLAFFLKFQKKRFIVQSHSSMYSLKNIIHILRLGLLFFSLRLSSKVLTVNPIEHTVLQKKYKLKNAIAFPNGVDTNTFKNLAMRRIKYSILFVGRLAPEKGLTTLFKAFEIVKKRIPNLSLTIIGQGPLDIIVQEALRKFPNNILHLPHVSLDELVKIYNTHEVFILPSSKEPFGIVVLESLSCETPVIAPNNCGAALFLKDYDCLKTFVPLNAIDLSKKIFEVINNPELMKIMGTNGRKIVVENFDWDVIGARLAKIYESLS